MTVPASRQRNRARATPRPRETQLVYVTDAAPGIARKGRPGGFRYLRGGARIDDPAELERIAKLAIPPAYTDVWICADPRGHLQATGRDARGRKQYRYHSAWRALRDREKFDRMPAFGDALPRLRRRLRRDLALEGMPRERVLAVVASLLDATLARVGNAEYARENDSYGLTTLRNRHVRFVRNGRALLCFRGKGGADHRISVNDKRLGAMLRRCHQLPGQRLFQYVDDAGKLHPIDSEQVNLYLRESMGDDFTAKDFRTWGATLRAIAVLRGTPLPESRSERELAACVAETVRQVAAELRNTPAVCRKSYINPLVFEAWREGTLHRALGQSFADAPSPTERAVSAFLRRRVGVKRAQADVWLSAVASRVRRRGTAVAHGGSASLRTRAGRFRAEQENLRRIVNP